MLRLIISKVNVFKKKTKTKQKKKNIKLLATYPHLKNILCKLLVCVHVYIHIYICTISFNNQSNLEILFCLLCYIRLVLWMSELSSLFLLLLSFKILANVNFKLQFFKCVFTYLWRNTFISSSDSCYLKIQSYCFETLKP